ncbi:MAG: cysteine--tRNA ligase, partial [Bradyrhizobium sp.]|nr:cysteine--tRNA ligase [Bradyrhizobium sp.]
AIRKVTEQTEKQFHDDVDALGCLRPTVEPRATEHIVEMREIIERLVKGGFAYVAEDHVLFSPQAMNAANKILPRYGALANRSLDEMIAGARVDVAPYKRDPTDFVLWKPSKPDEPSWPSPAGIKVMGRPGWHMECSAMSWKHLGEEFDIHGGGIDLVFPHHENELAQSCCAFHRNRMANYWMHNGFLQVEGEKMSKSLGNFVTIRELLSDWPGEVLRLNMLKTHYRSPIDWTLKGVEESKKVLDSWYDIVGDDTQAFGEPDEDVCAQLGDDLNTSGAITRLHAIASSRVGTSGQGQLDVKRKLKTSAMLLGLLGNTRKQYLASNPKAIVVNREAVDALIADRTAARARKDFKESDRIRDELAAMGVVLKDSKEGTTWEVAR